jgi:chromate reductase, NAD(P)H dehydrogenase (quinone)
MLTIVALSGSLRRASYNTALLRAMCELVPEGLRLDLRTLHGIPLYDADVEAQGEPEPVSELRAAIRGADGLLICTPEYNNSMPGVLKNGLDWLSRPPAEGKKTFAGKPTALLGATPGGFGTVQSQAAMLSVLRAFSVDFWFGGRITLSRVQNLIDASGSLSDEATREQLRGFLQGFAAHVRHSKE